MTELDTRVVAVDARVDFVDNRVTTLDGRVTQVAADLGDRIAAIPVRANNSSARSVASATGADTLAVGDGARAAGDQALALGADATASGAASTAVGESARASAAGAVALGQAAQAAHAGSVAVGQGVTTTRDNQVVIGSSDSTYTLAGLGSPESLATQSGPVWFVTSDESGNLGLSGFDISRIDLLESEAAGLRADVLALGGQMERGLRHAYEGTALALAIGGAVLPAGASHSISAGWGTYRGEHAFAASGVAQVRRHLYVQGGVGIGSRSGTVGARAGATLAW